jgi:hypothetical protein
MHGRRRQVVVKEMSKAQLMAQDEPDPVKNAMTTSTVEKTNVSAPTMQSSILLTSPRMELEWNQGRPDGYRKDMGRLD